MGRRRLALEHEYGGYWYGNVTSAHAGQEYRFHLFTPYGEFSRIDPYAREVTNSVGNAVIHDPSFDWEEMTLRRPNGTKSSSTKCT